MQAAAAVVLAIELAHRGADVLGVDLSPQMVEHANEALPAIRNGGSVTLGRRRHAGRGARRHSMPWSRWMRSFTTTR
jgi:SAM-dependent methyltransferase